MSARASTPSGQPLLLLPLLGTLALFARVNSQAHALPPLISFVNDGERIQDDDTPDSLGLEDGDSVDVILERPSSSLVSCSVTAAHSRALSVTQRSVDPDREVRSRSSFCCPVFRLLLSNPFRLWTQARAYAESLYVDQSVSCVCSLIQGLARPSA